MEAKAFEAFLSRLLNERRDWRLIRVNHLELSGRRVDEWVFPLAASATLRIYFDVTESYSVG